MTDLDFTIRAMDFGMRAPLCASSIPEFDFHYVLTDPGFVAFRMLEVLEPASEDYQYVSCFLELWKDSDKDAAADYLSVHLDSCCHLVILQASVITYKGNASTADTSMHMLYDYFENECSDFSLQLLTLSLIIEWTVAYSPSVLSISQLVMQITGSRVDDFCCILQCARFFVYMDDFDEAVDLYQRIIILDEIPVGSDLLIQALARREIRQILDTIPEDMADIMDGQDNEFDNPFQVIED